MLTFAQKQNMTETIAYIKESLRDLYPSSEVSSLVRLIMERVCNIQPHHFLFCKDKELPESEKSRIHDIVERLKQMEPIQYILGTADFYSLQFEVDPSVLIPRPETEELVEQVILDNADQKIKILDIGTGSGCIAVTLRKHLKKASVIATDISAEALATARRNAKRNNTTVTFIQTDILDPEKAEMDIPFILDVIVSNPPYIKEELQDQERYQTVYSKEVGSAAAPTAGLHFTKELLEKIREKGVNEAFVTLHVGLGTFRPVKAEEVTEHHMHSELCMMNAETAKMLNGTKRSGGRIICVGTTSCRTLESLVNDDGTFEAKSKWTDIFIYPGYTFKAMDGLITNFHLPESTLVMLVSAFAGREHVLNAYEEAVKQRYRFFSFGDAMCIV